MRTPELKPLRIGEILDVSIKIYLRNALTFMAMVAIAVLPVMFIGTLALLSIAPDLSGVVTESEINAFVGGAIVIAIIQFIGGLIATGACFKGVGEAYLGKTPRTGESVRFAAKKAHSLLWILFLTLLFIALALFAAALPLALFAQGSDAGAVILGIAFLVVFAYLAVKLSLGIAALLAEGLRGTEAMVRSWGLVTGRWWATFAVLFVAILLIRIVGFIFDLVFDPLITVEPGETITSLTGLIVWNQIVGFIVGVLTQPFLSAVVAIAYFDLRVRKEGYDLELLARQIGEAPPTQPTGPTTIEEPSSPRLPPPPPPPPFPTGRSPRMPE
jgi:hypothetical protein